MIDMRPDRIARFVWLVWPTDETESDARRVRAGDAEEAAEDWAAWSDSHDAGYSIVGGSEVEVYVRREDADVVERYSVSGDGVPRYSARAI